ncbi:MAG TPA: TonB-dependent receptor [Pyrinomonadaceae bacterium]|nr:TonB-dependent receptor [Pyrinomonadaceae bacterium]
MKKGNFFRLRETFLAAISILAFAFAAVAQTETARIQGTVADTAGAVVAGATVTVRDAGTGRETKAVTDENGSYSILSLQPGKYQVEVAAANFRTIKQEVTITVAQSATLNFALEAGAVTETVTVTTDIPQVETSTSAIGNVVQGRQIVELPLNGRNVLELARLSPGVTTGVIGGDASGANGNAETYRGRNTGGAALSINGQRPQANNFLLDGVDNNESLVNSINILPSADTVQEFRVQTSVATAEFGRGGGGIINSVTKSGTNNFHGSSYLFIRNSVLDARLPFDDTRRLFRRGQFGGTIGGPVIIPGFGEGTPMFHNLKDKVFFFVGYEGLRQFLPIAQETATVPTAAFRNGDFSQLLTPSLSGLSAPIQLIDPLTNTPIPGNRVDLLPGNRMNSAALNYLRAYPLPNNGSGVLNNFKTTRNETDHQNDILFRVDANLNTRNQMYVRGEYGWYDQTVTSRLPTLPAGFGSGTNPTRTKGLAIGLSTTLTPTLFNELRVQGNKLSYGYEPPFGNEPLSQSLGIVNANRDSSLGGGALIGGYNGQLEYTGDYGPYRVPQETLQLVDSIAWVKGNHTFKFGGTVLHRNVMLFRPIAGKGYFRIYGNGDFTQCPGASGAPSQAASGNTGFEQANLLIGFMCSYQIGIQNGNVGTMNWENAAFAQDDWRVNSKLTLNLGLRYDYLTNPHEQYGRQANFDLTTGHLLLPSGKNDSQTQTDKNNFGPRVGFAYDLRGSGKSVIRGGYGLFYFLDRGGISNQLAQNPPFSGSSSFSFNDGYRITFTGQGPLGNNDNRLATAPLPLPTVNTSAAFLNNPLNADVLAIIPNNKVSNVHQFNIQYQQQLTRDTALSVGYVGTRGRNLILYYNLNGRAFDTATSVPCPISGRTLGSCYPGISSVNVRDDIGRSQYDSLQIQVERRFAKGLQYIAAYTFSKTKDNGEGAFDNKAGGNNYIEQFTTSRIDFPHVFSFENIYDLPWGRGRSFGSDMPKALDMVIGGWTLNSIFRAQSGSPFDVRDSDGRLVNLNGDAYTGRKDKTPYINLASFSKVSTGFGTLQRNSLRGPANFQWNIGLSKDFRFTETAKLQFRTQAYNVLNNIQWGTPNTDLNNPDPTFGFGTIRGVSPFSNRQIEFGLRLEF